MWCLQATTLIQEVSMLGTEMKAKYSPKDYDVLDKTVPDPTEKRRGFIGTE